MEGRPIPVDAARARGRISRTFQAFGYRDFRLMWAGAFTSTTGTWMQTVAQSWLIVELTGAAAARYLGLVGFLADLPILLFSLFGGVLADRIDRRKSLLGSQYTQMTSAFILTLLVAAGWVKIWHILVLVAISGTGQSFGGPAYQALIPGLVKREDVPNAVALNSIQFNLARVIGPLLAAATFAAFGFAMCFALNGVSFIAVIISLYLIRASFIPQRTGESVLAGLRGGFSYLLERGSLWQLSILGFVSTFCGIPLMNLLPLFAKNVFGMGPKGYAYLVATSGAGAIAGALLYAGVSHSGGQGKLALKVQLAFAILLAIFALSRNPLLSYLALFLGGICLITLFAAINSLVQMNVTDEMRGRVMSIFMLAFRGGMPIGNLVIVTTLAQRLSPSIALVTASGVLMATALGFLLGGSKVKAL